MPDIIIWIGVFVLSLTTLIVAADVFIKVSERIGLSLGIPAFVIGVTLVALGTSLPELVTSIIAVVEGASTIVMGNVVGSNIANTCLILGLVGVVGRKIHLKFDLMRVDLPMMMGSAFLLFLAALDRKFSLFEALLCIGGLILYLAYVFYSGRNNEFDLDETQEKTQVKISFWDPLKLLGAVIIIYFSADYNVESIQFIARYLDVGEELVALTAVSMGTSLPELVVSVVAVRSKNAEMAVGNILGSNIFNIFCVMGIPRLFGMVSVPDGVLAFALPAMLVASFLTFFVLQDRVLNRWEGWILLLAYAVFISNVASFG
ncbi:MAG: calcium/sodium antiporter [Bacteroidota bacterium]